MAEAMAEAGDVAAAAAWRRRAAASGDTESCALLLAAHPEVSAITRTSHSDAQ